MHTLHISVCNIWIFLKKTTPCPAVFGGSIYRKMIKVQKKKMGVAVLAAAAMLAAMVTVVAGDVPLTDKADHLESEESMWNLYAYIYERGGRLNMLLVNGDVAG